MIVQCLCFGLVCHDFLLWILAELKDKFRVVRSEKEV